MRDGREAVNAMPYPHIASADGCADRSERQRAEEQARAGFARLACARVGQEATHRDVGSAAKAPGAPAAPISS